MRNWLFPLAGALAALPILTASAALPESGALVNGAAYLKANQLPDGGYASSPGQTMDAIYAVRAAGYDPSKDFAGGKSPVDYLVANAAAVTAPAAAAKAALAARALGLDPAAVGGVDFIAVTEAGYDSASGAYAGDAFSQSIAMLGLECTGNESGAKAVDWLRAEAVSDGGWGFGGAADADTTAIATQAMVAAGVPASDPVLVKALAYLKASQAADGGWGFDPAASNTSSTAFAVQALIALGEDPESAAYTKSGVTPVAFLVGQQAPDGSFAGFDPGFATNQVLPALAGRTFCNAPETAITRTRPVEAPSPAATPSPAPSPSPAATVEAPKPPATGDSASQDGGGAAAVLALVGVLAVIAGGGIGLAGRARRKA